MKKWIVVSPEGGIGNRLRVIASALVAAENEKRSVYVIWKKTSECACYYEDVFEPTPLFDVASAGLTRLATRLHRSTGIPFPGVFLPVASRAGRNILTVDTDKLAKTLFRVHPSDIVDYPVIYFDDIYWDFMVSGMSPAAYDEKIKRAAKQMVPVRKISRRLLDIPSPKVGVHIRHREAPDAIRISPLDKFIAAMETSVRQDARTKFFLATDLPSVEQTLNDVFPDRIFSLPKASYGRDETGVNDALVDLFMLSRCDRVLGSYWSSFSEYAALIGGVDLEVIGVGPSPGPAQGILKRAYKFERYGGEGWKQGWTPDGPPVAVS